MKFEKRVVLVTGAGRGIGRSIALRFAEEGADVAIVARTAAQLSETAKQVEALGRRALPIPADITRSGTPEACVAATEERLGPIDVLVNNAGVFVWRPFLQLSPDDWDRVIATNLTAAAAFCRAALARMVERRRGRIVNVASIYSFKGAANRVAYVTTKTAMLGLTRAVALEGLPHGITCNAVCPGTTETPVHQAAIASLAAGGLTREEAERRFFSTKQPTGRFISAEQVAALMVFLCGPDAGDITGAALPVDGGWSAS